MSEEAEEVAAKDVSPDPDLMFFLKGPWGRKRARSFGGIKRGSPVLGLRAVYALLM